MTQKPSIYNQLSAAVKERFQVLYSEYRGDNITTFRSHSKKWGAILDGSKILLPAQYGSIYYNTDFQFFECVVYHEEGDQKTKTFLFFDQSGKLLNSFDNFESCRGDEFGNARFQETGTKKWGILDRSFHILIEPKYENIRSVSADLFVAQLDAKWGLIDQHETVLMDFVAPEVWGSFQNACIIMRIEDAFKAIDDHGVVVKTLPISHILRPSSNSYWYSFNKNQNLRKVIAGGELREETDEFYPFDELTDYVGKWGIMDLSGNIQIAPEYDYIDFFGLTSCYKVLEGECLFQDDPNGLLTLHGTKSGVIDAAGATVIPTQYDWIDEIAPDLWAVNVGGQVYYYDDYHGYWTVMGGKWGVVSAQNRLIVPIEYDVIMLNWFRVKDLILVQNGTTNFNGSQPFDAYTLDGKKVDSSRIDYKEHIFYRR